MNEKGAHRGARLCLAGRGRSGLGGSRRGCRRSTGGRRRGLSLERLALRFGSVLELLLQLGLHFLLLLLDHVRIDGRAIEALAEISERQREGDFAVGETLATTTAAVPFFMLSRPCR